VRGAVEVGSRLEKLKRAFNRGHSGFGQEGSDLFPLQRLENTRGRAGTSRYFRDTAGPADFCRDFSAEA